MSIDETGAKMVRAFVWVIGGLFALLVVTVAWSLAFGEWGNDGPSDEYTNCEAAAQRIGLKPSDPDYLVKIGQCMERLENE